jgi:hypothetical protein
MDHSYFLNHTNNMRQQEPKNFNENFFFKPKMTIPKPIARMTKSICIAIDSKDRDTNIYANANKFRVKFNTSNNLTNDAPIATDLKNISSIKMIECVLPSSIQSERYLVLVIPELTVSMDGTNDILSKAFCILYPDKVYGSSLRCDMSDTCNCFKKYSPPLGRIDSLTFELYNPEGELLTLGVSDDVFYKLEFRTYVANTSDLNENTILNF